MIYCYLRIAIFSYIVLIKHKCEFEFFQHLFQEHHPYKQLKRSYFLLYYIYIYIYIYIYTECPGVNVPDFGRMFLKLKYTDINLMQDILMCY